MNTTMNDKPVDVGSIFRMAPMTEAFSDCFVKEILDGVVLLVRPWVSVRGEVNTEHLMVKLDRLTSGRGWTRVR